MTKHVPEGSVQTDSLREELLGNQVFGRVRGKLGVDVIGVVSAMVSQAKSPTEFCRLWDRFTGDVRVMGTKLAQFDRDDWATAQGVLAKALSVSDYMLPGETVPVQATTPVTVIMPDPERTLHMIRWICEGHWKDLDNWLDGKSQGGSLVNRLFQLFPALEHTSRERRQQRSYEGWDLCAAFKREVTDKLDILTAFPRSRPVTLAYRQFNNHLELNHEHGEEAPTMALAFIVVGEQGKVLSSFDRDTQGTKLASWQLHLPTAMVQKIKLAGRRSTYSDDAMGINGQWFCFHPESEHSQWKIEHPALVSRGVSRGFGVIFKPRNNEDVTCAALGESSCHKGWHSRRESLRFALR
jgi:hypothetical protein